MHNELYNYGQQIFSMHGIRHIVWMKMLSAIVTLTLWRASMEQSTFTWGWYTVNLTIVKFIVLIVNVFLYNSFNCL